MKIYVTFFVVQQQLLVLLLFFLTFSVLVANPEKTTVLVTHKKHLCKKLSLRFLKK